MSAREEQASGHSSKDNPAPRPSRTDTNSSSYFTPPKLPHRQTVQSFRQTRPNQEPRPSYHLQPVESAQTQQQGDESEPTAQESRRAHAHAHSLQRQQTEKQQYESHVVDNDYFDLNPWYDQGPKKPVFGMNKPLPRTVRPGMLWGRKDLHKAQESTAGGNHDGELGESQDAPTLHVPLGEKEEYPPDFFDAEIGGRQYVVRRIGAQYGEKEDERPSSAVIDREHHAPEPGNEEVQSHTRPKYSSGYSGAQALSPLKETQSAQSFDTTLTDRAQNESREREEEALQDYYNKYRNPLARLRAKYPEAPAEFLCTTIYVFFGIAGSLYAQIYPAVKGDYQTQAWAWGMAVMAGIYVGGGVSGAHMSPWISVSFSVFRGFPWKMCLVYCIVQILAGLVAGALAWSIYRDGILHADPGLTPSTTGMAFYYLPQTYASTTTAFFNSFVSSAFYVCLVFAIGDDSNSPPGSGMSALIYGLVTYLLCITMGFNGLGISPARDLGPRFIAWWVGYGSDTFATGWWAYGPVLAGLSGSLAGALLYDIFIFAGGESPVNYHWPTPGDVKWRYRARKEQVKEHARKLEPV